MSVCDGFEMLLGPHGRPLTDEQLEAVQLRDGPLLLDANAGSGKTTVMVERFVRAVLCDGVPVGGILAITFTDKAAAELRDRIRRRFAELDEHERAREAEGAFISTIHGFCARILRSHPLDAGLDPRFAVIDEPQADRLSGLAFDAALETVLAAGGDDALDALSAFKVSDLRDLTVAAHGALRTRGQTRPRLPEVAPRDLASACADLVGWAQALAGELDGTTVATELTALEAVGTCRARLAGTGPPASGPALTLDEADELKIPGRVSGRLRSEAAAGYRTAHAEVRRACLDHAALPAHRRIGELVAGFADRYAELKAERSGLDFEDLELRALDLLRTRPTVRERYASRFAHVMVDEFQDTNPLQLDLLDQLSAERRFVVGDAFQSIYRFRHADVGLFSAERERLEALGRVRVLTGNFRSRPELIDAFNLAFAGDAFPTGFAPLAAGVSDAPEPAAGPAVELLLTSKNEAWAEEDLGATSPSAAWRLAEARLLAERVRALRDAGRPAGEIVLLLRATTDMRVFERALEDQGVATYLIGGRGYWSQRQVRDLVAYLALLANPRDDLRLYEALCSPLAGVSADTLVLLAEAAGSGRRICEVLDLVAGGDPADADGAEDDVEAGAAPAEIAGHAASGAPLAEIAGDDAERLAVFWRRFAVHRAEAPRLALDALIERVVRDAGFDLAVLRMPGGERRMANVRKLMRLAREYESAEGRDLRGLVDHVDVLAGDVDGRDREGEAPVEGEDLDAVRIMTVHRAKGLEFPVVCVADLGREPFTGGRQYLRIGRDGTVGLKVPGLGDTETPGAFDWDAIGKAEAQADADEERRLFYVAMTRAREHLILSGSVDLEHLRAGRSREPLGWIGPAVAGPAAAAMTAESPMVETTAARGRWSARVACSLNAPATLGVVLPREAQAPVPASPGAGTASPDSRTPVSPPASGAQRLPLGHLSYSSLGDHARCGYRFYLERILGLPREPEPRAAEGEGLAAAMRGTLVHEMLEGLDFARPAVPGDAAVADLAAMHGVTPTAEERDEIATLVAGFAGSALCGRLAAAPRVLREESFGFLLPSAGAEPMLINGVIDALAWDGDRALVVDYKTDRVGEGDLAARVQRAYRTQQVVYALAALHAGATEVDVAHVFLRRPGEPVVTRFGAAEARELEEELAGLAVGILAGEYTVAPEPHRWLCQTCPGRASLCSWGPEMTGREPPWAA